MMQQQTAEGLPAEIRSEKRWIASVMIDLVGSTALVEQLGPEQAFALTQEVLRDAVQRIEQEGGHFVEFAGDSVFAIFGAPVAVENATLAACRAALSLQRALTARAAQLEARFGVAPSLRVGIAAGEVLIAALTVTGSGRLNALGNAVNLAARIEALARPGEILCSEAVAREIRGHAEVTLQGEHALKGIARRQRVYRLEGLRDHASSLEARLARGSGGYVGRAEPLARLRAWLQGGAEAGPPVLAVTGPAGIGKSRIVRHALAGLGAEVVPSIAHCAETDPQGLLRPVLGLIRAAAAAEGADSPPGIARWLAARLDGAANATLVELIARSARRAGAPEGGADNSDATAGNAGGTPAALAPDNALDLRRQIAAVLRALAGDPGRLLVVEDAHWLDPLSRELLQGLVAAAPPGLRLLLTSRTTNDLELPADRQAGLALAPLAEAEVVALIASGFPGLEVPDALCRHIFQRTEGNPLFVEEVLHLLRDSHEADGILHLPDRLEIGSIQNLIFSRFDLMSPRDKMALKLAAVLGRVIRPHRLQVVSGGAAEAVLTAAAQRGLVEPLPGSGNWRFAHALMQEAIAASLPRDEAARLHGAAADLLLAEAAESGDVAAADIARHFDLAGRSGAAVRWYLQAAQAALRVYALDSCLAQLDRARTLSDAGAEVGAALFADLTVTHCRVLDIVGNWARLIEVAERDLPRLAEMPDRRPHVVCLTMFAKACNQMMRESEALASIDAALRLAEEMGDAQAIAITRTVKMDVVNDRMDGMHRDLDRLFAETRAYAETGQDPQMTILRLYEMSASRRTDGDVIAALGLCEEMLRFGRARSDSRALAFGSWLKASILAMLEDHEAVRIAAAEGMRHALPGTMDYTTAHVFHLGAQIMTGSGAVTNAELEALSGRRLAVGDISVGIIAAFYSAALHFIEGRVRAGRQQLAHTEALVRRGTERGMVLQFLFKKAELMLTVAGLLPGPLPAPRLPLAELPAALSLRLQARRIARDSYDEISRRFDLPDDGVQRARMEMGRGLLARGARRHKAAEAHLATALRLFEAQEAGCLSGMVRSALR